MKLSRPALLASLLTLPFVAIGASTDLSDSPLSNATETEVRPNILFILDDSNSMKEDGLTDATTSSVGYKKKNRSFNGLAYNPGTRYYPPSYVTSTGTPDTTTYPSQTSLATDGWTKVKDDGYGVQYPLSSTSALVGDTGAYYYTTVPGEFCTDKTLKTCIEATTPSGSHPIPAMLRWCKTEGEAIAATPSAGACQALRIEDSDGGYPSFKFARMPAPRISVLTITGSGATTVSSIKVDNKEILLAATSGTTSCSKAGYSTSAHCKLAEGIIEQINKCTSSLTSPCDIVGYRAELGVVSTTSAEVIISAPGITTDTPSVLATAGAMTLATSPFAKPSYNQAPGDNLLTAITSTTTAYPKSSKRTDCAGTTCTYAEEMTNYANWWAYYYTRMQAMKTATSRAFEPIGNKYRIGYYSINNNTGTDFQNISEFDGAQKYAWYKKLFAATPYRADGVQANTPLRVALAKAGRLYAGRFEVESASGNKMNNVVAVDPLQYYCQPNVTILSTDGYWTEGAGFKLDGSTLVGDQDGCSPKKDDYGNNVTDADGNDVIVCLEERPMLDGGAGVKWQSTERWTKQRVPTEATWTQTKIEQWEKRTAQWQKRTLTRNQVNTSRLQTRTAQQQAQEYRLQARHRTINYAAPLLRYNQRTAQLQSRTGSFKSRTAGVLKRTATQTKKQTSHLQSRTGNLQKKIHQLQQRLTQVQARTSSNSGSSWTAWSDVASCTPVSSGKNLTQCQTLTTGNWINATSCTVNAGATVVNNPGTDYESTTYNTQSECQYVDQGWASAPSCSGVTKSGASPFTVGQGVECQTDWTAWVNVDNCTVSTVVTGTQSTSTACQYNPTWSASTDVESCTNVPKQTSSPYTVAEAVNCAFNQWTPWAAVTGADPTCVVSTSSPQVGCTYASWSGYTPDSGCVDAPKTTATTNGAVYKAAKECRTTWGSWTNVTGTDTCDAVSTGPAQVQCRYASWSSWSSAGMSCSPVEVSVGPHYPGSARECAPVWGASTVVTDCTPSATTQCTTAWTAWTDVISGGCTATSTDGTGGAGSTECQYRISTPWYNVDNCTEVPQSTYPNYTENNPRSCQTTWNSWSDVTSGSCTPVTDRVDCMYSDWSGWVDGACPNPPSGLPRSASAPYEVLTASDCRTEWSDWANAPSCEGNTTTECRIDWPLPEAWTNTAPCTSTDLQDCRTKIVKDWGPALPDTSEKEPVLTSGENCTSPGTSESGLITSCRTLIPNPSPIFAVESCVSDPANLGAPILDSNQVKTVCTPYVTEAVTVEDCENGKPPATESNNYTHTKCVVISKGSTPDTLADVAEYYWRTDLRTPGQTPDVCDGGLTAAGTVTDVCLNNPEKKPRQFMTTYTLGLGASGVMQYDDMVDYANATSGDFYAIKTGADAAAGNCSWQKFGECNWPKPGDNKQTNIDDLWHAAVNGRGKYFSASNPDGVSSGISSALNTIDEEDGALAAVTVTGSTLVSGSTGMFQVAFTAGNWTGEVKKVTLGIGADNNLTLTPIWSARSKLDAKVYTSRNIYMFTGTGTTNLATFEWGNLSTAQKAYFTLPNIAPLSQFCSTGTACLDATSQGNAAGESLVNFLRGDRTNEGLLDNTGKYFRSRAFVLGDIVGSEAVYVQTSPWPYTDTGHSAFRATTASRAGMVYVGANDGMLHAFKEADGDEAWAYVPDFVMSGMYQLADKRYNNKHSFFVDGTPVMGDICTANCGPESTTATWKTILVGGANRGGRGYYALDITDPANPKGLWEFTNNNLGYSYGNPVITKLVDGTWVVLVASGYNNTAPGDGKGYLFVLNADTGALITSISTNAGDGSAPSGLSRISAWANYPSYNNTAQRVYGGDLLGNLWRFDINDIIAPAGNEAQRLATLKDASGNAQPITSRPELGFVKNKPVVFVGTGQLLGLSDVTTTGTHSLYAIKDRLSASDYGNPRAATNSFVQQTMTVDGTCAANATYCVAGQTKITVTKNEVDWATNDGWYVDLPVGGERVNTDMTLLSGTLVFTTNTPKYGACSPAGVSYTYALDYLTGGYVEGTSGLAGYHLGDYLSTHPVLIGLPGGAVGGLVQGDCPSCLNKTPVPIDPQAPGKRRVSWRELVVE